MSNEIEKMILQRIAVVGPRVRRELEADRIRRRRQQQKESAR